MNNKIETSQLIENINKEFSDISKDLTLKGCINSVNKSTHLLLIYQYTGNIFKIPTVLSDINLFLFRLNGNKYNLYSMNDLINQKLGVTFYIILNME